MIRCLSVIVLLLSTRACQHKTYQSACDESRTYQTVALNDLQEHLSDYHGKWIEVQGVCFVGSEISVIYTKIPGQWSVEKAIWLMPNKDCPMKLAGTAKKLFENYRWKSIVNKTIRLHGQVDTSFHGHLNMYKGSIVHISMMEVL